MAYKETIRENGEKNNMEGDFTETQNNLPERSNIEAEAEQPAADDIESELPREKIMAELEDLYDEREAEMNKIFDKAKDDIDASGAAVNKIKGGVRVKGGGINKTDFGLRKELLKSQQTIESRIEQLEKNALEIPKNMEGQPEDVPEFKKETPEYVRDYKKETGILAEELRLEREEFVRKFIEDSLNSVLDNFKGYLDEAENGKNAKEIIALKTEKEIELAARRFIKEGGAPDFGFAATLEISSFEDKKQGKLKYITGYAINAGGYKKKVREADTVLSSGREKLRHNRRRGGIKKENNNWE